MSKRHLAIPLLLLLFSVCFYLFNYIKLTSDIPKKTVESLIPKFKFRSLNNIEFTQENIINKDVVFYFFSPDCGECNKMSKKISELTCSFPNIQVLMVSNESKEVLLKYSNTLSCRSFNILIDEQNFSINNFSITSIPTIMIYNKGVLKERIIGNVKLSFIKEKIQN